MNICSIKEHLYEELPAKMLFRCRTFNFRPLVLLQNIKNKQYLYSLSLQKDRGTKFHQPRGLMRKDAYAYLQTLKHFKNVVMNNLSKYNCISEDYFFNTETKTINLRH